MGYTIEYSYDDLFVSLMEGLKEKYGQELFDIDGIGKQLDIYKFNKAFFSPATKATADVSVDANGNVDDNSPITYVHESMKPNERLNSYYFLWEKMRELFSLEEANKVVEMNLIGDIYINDMHGIESKRPYCFNYATYDILTQGLPMIEKITSLPPKNLLSFRSQVEQFTVLAANSTLGATGLADFLISCSFYMKKILDTKADAHFHFASEEDCWEYFKQTVISFIYTLNQPLRANQSPFTNISLYDKPFLKSVTEGIIFPDGSSPDIDLIQKMQLIYMDAMNEEMDRTAITFPVTTACFATQDGKLLDENYVNLISEKNKKYGFINIYMGDSATLSSCCRLRSSTKNEFFNSLGSGSSKIGSLGVVTINFPRLAHKANSIEDFEEALKENVHLVSKVNYCKRELIRESIEAGHQPLYDYGFSVLKKQYSTVGVNGFYECFEILGKSLLTEEGMQYAEHLMKFLNDEVDLCQKEFQSPHNIEQIPAENVSVKFCKKDKYLGLDLGVELYSNQFIPLTSETDMLNRIILQGRIEKYFSGGSILHLNVAEKIESTEDMVNLIKLCAEKGVVYFAINYIINKCKDNHMSIGHQKVCPVCGKELVGTYTRVVGFLTNIASWNPVRRKLDFPNRKFYTKDQLSGTVNQ